MLISAGQPFCFLQVHVPLMPLVGFVRGSSSYLLLSGIWYFQMIMELLPEILQTWVRIGCCDFYWLRVLFLGLVLLSAGRWGPVNSTIAGKCRNWYPGSSGCQNPVTLILRLARHPLLWLYVSWRHEEGSEDRNGRLRAQMTPDASFGRWPANGYVFFFFFCVFLYTNLN